MRPGLSATTNSVSFPNTYPGIGRTAVVDITNSGTTSEALRAVVAPRRPFGVRGTPAAGTILQPGQTIAVQVTYSPLAAGHANSTLTISADHGSPITIELSGNAIKGDARLTATPAALDFGQVSVGQSRTLNLQVFNPGGQPLSVLRPVRPGGGFSLSPEIGTGQPFGPDNGLRMTVTFAPHAVGRATTLLEIPYAPTGMGTPGRLTVRLTGNAGPS
jgi:hypothetical protein